MLTPAEVEQRTYRKAQLETEVQGTTPERKAEIEAELGRINSDMDAHAREKDVPAQRPQTPRRVDAI